MPVRKLPFLLILFAAALYCGGCAVKSYPRPVEGDEQLLVTVSHTVDRAGSKVAPKYRLGRRYSLDRQTPRVEYTFYLDYRIKADPGLFYRKPSTAPAVEFVSTLKENKKVLVRSIRWHSQYWPTNPDFALRYATYPETQEVYGVLVQSKAGNKGVVIILHDWADRNIDRLWKSEDMLDYVEKGYDALLIQLPYHGLRSLKGSVFSGEHFFSGEIARVNEAVCQSIVDLMSARMWLRMDYATVGLKGRGLGGLIVLQAAAVDSDFDFVLARDPLTSLGDLPPDNPIAPFALQGMKVSDLDYDQVKKILFISSPANFDPVVSIDRVMIVSGMGNAFAPPEQAQMLINRWGVYRVLWYAGGEFLNLRERSCRKSEILFMREFLPGYQGEETKRSWWKFWERKKKEPARAEAEPEAKRKWRQKRSDENSHPAPSSELKKKWWKLPSLKRKPSPAPGEARG